MRPALAWCLAALHCTVSGCQLDPPNPVGSTCSTDLACAGGLCVQQYDDSSGTIWSGGYCSGECTRQECIDGACVSLGDGRSYCLATCGSTDECRSGYICSSAFGACIPDCRMGWSCGDTLECSADTGSCELPSLASSTQSTLAEQASLSPLPIGSACNLNADCTSALCTPETLGDTATGWPLGYCTQTCAEAGACPTNSTCVSFEDGTSFCTATCTSSSDCRNDYVCATAVGGCLPDCRNGWSCGTRLTCNMTTGGCALPTDRADAGATAALSDASIDTNNTPTDTTPTPGMQISSPSRDR